MSLRVKDKNRGELVKAIINQNKGRYFTVVAKRKKPKVTYENSYLYINEVTTFSESEYKKFIKDNPNTVEHFVRKEDHFMEMTCRTGVTKHLKGGDSTIRHCEDLISVNVVPSQRKNEKDTGYRCFSVYNVLSIKCGGTEIKFDEQSVLECEV